MKKLILLFSLILFISNRLNAQAPSIEWQKSYGGTNEDWAWEIQQTSDGGYIVCGYTLSNNGDITANQGNRDYWVLKVDEVGNIEWSKTYGGSMNDIAISIIENSEGDFLVVGHSYSDDGDVSNHFGNTNTNDCWVVKLDELGSVLWEKSYGGSSSDIARAIQQTTDGYIIAGSTSSNDGDVTYHFGTTQSIDYWVFKIDNDGVILWEKSYGGLSNDQAMSIDTTSDGGYIVAGVSESNDGDVTGNNGGQDYWIVKTNSIGSIEWQKAVGGTFNDGATASIQQTLDGGYIVAGYSPSNDGLVSGHHGSSDTNDCWVVKFDNLGSIEWENSFGGFDEDFANATIIQTNDAGYIFIGQSKSDDGDVSGNHGGYDSWAVKLDNAGIIQWQKSLGGSNADVGYTIKQTTDGGYIIANVSNSNDGDVTGNHGNYDYWIVKLGCTNPDTSVTDLGTALQANADNMTYQWLDCDNNYLPVNGAIQQIFNPATSSGIYAVVISDGACSDTSNCHIVLGVGFNEIEKEIKIYPNPVKSEITVSGYSPAYLKLCNAVGQTVAESPSNKLYVGNLSQGLYVLQLFDANGQQVKTEKVIVAK